jgi:hypothetical protein
MPSTDKRPRIRLVIADIDGTLINKQKILTQQSIQAIKKLNESGIIFGVTTGRPPAGVKMFIDPLPHLRFIAGFNGGVIVNREFKIFKENLMDAVTAKEVVRVTMERGLDAWLYTDTDWYVRDPNAYRVDRESQTVQFGPKVAQTFEGLYEKGVAKIVGVSQDYDAVARCEKDIQTRFAARTSAARSQPFYLDVSHPNANKGEVVLAASDYFDIPTQDIATIGDMPNDVTMFAKSGVSIAMGNAHEKVQQAATLVTASNDEEGFAEAINNFILRGKVASAA